MAECFDKLDYFIFESIKAHLYSCEENKVFSPFEPFSSVIPLLQYLKTKHRDEKTRLLGNPTDPEINDAINYFHSLKDTHKGFKSNSLYLVGDPEARDVKIPSNLQIEQNNVDFHEKKTFDELTEWIKTVTNDKIEKFLDQSSVLSAKDILILTNSNFSANWHHQFIDDSTKLGDFTLASGNKIQAQMMESIADYEHCYSETFDARFINVEFLGSDIAVIFARPNKHNGVEKLKKNLFNKSITDFAASIMELEFERSQIKFHLPKLDFTSETSFKKTFQEMGHENLFQNIFEGVSAQRDMGIDNIHQAVRVNFNEKALNDCQAKSSAGQTYSVESEDTIEFSLNHPFMFVVMANACKCPLYIGQVYNP